MFTGGAESTGLDSTHGVTTTAAAVTANALPAVTELNRPSLSKIVLSLEGCQAKQQALQKILQSLQILYARYLRFRRQMEYIYHHGSVHV